MQERPVKVEYRGETYAMQIAESNISDCEKIIYPEKYQEDGHTTTMDWIRSRIGDWIVWQAREDGSLYYCYGITSSLCFHETWEVVAEE